MSDLAVTASQVAIVTAGAGAGTIPTVILNGQFAAVAMTAGFQVYLDTSSSQYRPTNVTASTSAIPAGILLNSAPGAGQPITIATGGDVQIGGGATISMAYMPSSNAGGIAPVTDATTGWYPGILCVAVSTNRLRIGIISNAGTSKP